jgi:hypothetical protein
MMTGFLDDVARFASGLDRAPMSQIRLERHIARALELAIESDRLDVADHRLDAL